MTPDINQISKEFYAQYGLAMHTAQTIENGLHFLYALVEYRQKNISKIEYLKTIAKPMSFGQLKNKFQELKYFDNETFFLLERLNKHRRFLAHRFWWERDLDFSENNKLRELHLEIMSYILDFEKMTPIIDNRIKTIRETNNIYIEKEFGLRNLTDIIEFVNRLNKQE